jgi:hypothetical protein
MGKCDMKSTVALWQFSLKNPGSNLGSRKRFYFVNINFVNYNGLTLSPRELPTMTSDPIKLPFYSKKFPSISQKD